jgi:hypothetical protein
MIAALLALSLAAADKPDLAAELSRNRTDLLLLDRRLAGPGAQVIAAAVADGCNRSDSTRSRWKSGPASPASSKAH